MKKSDLKIKTNSNLSKSLPNKDKTFKTISELSGSRIFSFVLLIMLASNLIFNTGCSTSKRDSSGSNGNVVNPNDIIQPILPPNVPGAPGTPNNDYNSSTNTWSTGGSGDFIPASTETFNMWAGSFDPKSFKININLKEIESKGTYAGEVKIRYTQNGSTYEATLSSGTASYKGQDYFQYNKWFNLQGANVFSGFFEDKYGAIVLVIDKKIDNGDGGGFTHFSGSVWYRNFTKAFSEYDQGAYFADAVLPCWFRSIGPYDCRSSIALSKSALYPSDTYKKLGTYNNISRVKAFNLE